MKIYPCGISVKVTQLGLHAVIETVSIKFDSVQYEVSYFIEGKQQLIWLNEVQFTTTANKVTIGYKA